MSELAINLAQRFKQYTDRLYRLEKDGLGKTEYFQRLLQDYNKIIAQLKKEKHSLLFERS